MPNRALMTFALLTIVLMGCSPDHPLKLGYEGTSYDDPEIQEAVKKELSKRSINFYTFVEDGQEVIAYRKEDKDKVSSISREATGGPPEGYTGLCYETASRARKQQQLLENNQIQSVERKIRSTHCVYWAKGDSDKVAEIDQHYKEIHTHQKQMGNEL